MSSGSISTGRTYRASSHREMPGEETRSDQTSGNVSREGTPRGSTSRSRIPREDLSSVREGRITRPPVWRKACNRCHKNKRRCDGCAEPPTCCTACRKGRNVCEYAISQRGGNFENGIRVHPVPTDRIRVDPNENNGNKVEEEEDDHDKEADENEQGDDIGQENPGEFAMAGPSRFSLASNRPQTGSSFDVSESQSMNVSIQHASSGRYQATWMDASTIEQEPSRCPVCGEVMRPDDTHGEGEDELSCGPGIESQQSPKRLRSKGESTHAVASGFLSPNGSLFLANDRSARVIVEDNREYPSTATSKKRTYSTMMQAPEGGIDLSEFGMSANCQAQPSMFAFSTFGTDKPDMALSMASAVPKHTCKSDWKPTESDPKGKGKAKTTSPKTSNDPLADAEHESVSDSEWWIHRQEDKATA